MYGIGTAVMWIDDTVGHTHTHAQEIPNKLMPSVSKGSDSCPGARGPNPSAGPDPLDHLFLLLPQKAETDPRSAALLHQLV